MLFKGILKKNCCHKVLFYNSPNDHDDAIEDIVRVLDVPKGPVDQNLQQHLQREEAGEHNVTDLQCVGQLIGLVTQTKERKRRDG